jgi:hypothetical protein
VTLLNQEGTVTMKTGYVMGAASFRGECEQGNWGERGNRF